MPWPSGPTFWEHDNGITNFHFEIEAELLVAEELELLGRMRPGLVQLEIGVQSANPKTLEAVRRKTDLISWKKSWDRSGAEEIFTSIWI